MGNLNYLRVPPGNNLETLSGKLIGKQSITINDQCRIIFGWKEHDAYDVQIINFHKG